MENKCFGRMLVACFAVLMLNIPVSAASKASLVKKIQEKDPWPIAKTYYADYDGDGKKEIFAFLGGEESNRTWFASDKEVKQLVYSGAAYYNMLPKHVCKISDKQRLFIFETGAFGSGSTSHCYYVKNGKVKEVKNVSSGLTQAKGKKFYIFPSAFDHYVGSGGHTYKRYYLKWNGSKFQEYKGTRLSLSKLKNYTGGASIINKAQAQGYSVGEIYKRSNGIINVNLSKQGSYFVENENLTLKLSGSRVKLVQIQKPANEQVTLTWIQKYSYGGSYKASFKDE